MMTVTSDGETSRNQMDEAATYEAVASRLTQRRSPRGRVRLWWAAAITIGFGLMLLAAAALGGDAVLRSFEASNAAVQAAAVALDDQRLLLAAERLNAGMLHGDASSPQAADAQVPSRLAVDAALSPDDLSKMGFASGSFGMTELAALQARLAVAIQAAAARQPALDKHRITWEQRSFVMLLVTGNLAVVLFFCASALSLLFLHGQAESWRNIERARRSVLESERKRASFLAAAGHDLRQPLQALGLFLGALLQRPLDLEAQALGRKIEMTAEAMRRMIDSLLDVAKFDAGLVAADMQDVQLNALLDSFHGEFSRLADAAGISLNVEPTAAIVYADPALLEAVLRNLLSNAIKYTRRGSVRLSAVQQPSTVLLEVADTGIGIPADMLDQIFQDFSRGETGGADGLGLGLGIVRRLASLMQITVTVRSAVGTGSVFSLAVPAGTAASGPVERDLSPVVADAPRLRALLVEDNDLVRESLAGQLDCWDLDVVQASSGAQARALLQAGQAAFDVVIVDFHLGDTTGLALLCEMNRERSHDPCGIVITGSDDRAELDRLKASPYVWLRKPVDLAALEQEVRRSATKARERKQLANLIECL